MRNVSFEIWLIIRLHTLISRQLRLLPARNHYMSKLQAFYHRVLKIKFPFIINLPIIINFKWINLLQLYLFQHTRFLIFTYQGLYNIMNREEVLELIEAVVRPLREKVDYLEKENEKLKIQITSQNYEPQRLRSISRQQHKITKKEDQVDGKRSPSIKKRDQKPVWSPAGRARHQAPAYKSPPPVDKNKVKPVSPKVTTPPQSKQKHQKPAFQKRQSQKKSQVEYLSFQRAGGNQIKIKGGQRFNDDQSNNQSHLKTESVENSAKQTPKHNIQSVSSQEHSSHRGSQLLAHEQQGS